MVLDLTDRAHAWCRGRGDGLLHVFVPHATAGLAVLETGAGSDDDLLAALGLNVDNHEREVRFSFLAG